MEIQGCRQWMTKELNESILWKQLIIDALLLKQPHNYLDNSKSLFIKNMCFSPISIHLKFACLGFQVRAYQLPQKHRPPISGRKGFEFLPRLATVFHQEFPSTSRRIPIEDRCLGGLRFEGLYTGFLSHRSSPTIWRILGCLGIVDVFSTVPSSKLTSLAGKSPFSVGNAIFVKGSIFQPALLVYQSVYQSNLQQFWTYGAHSHWFLSRWLGKTT